MAEKFLRHQQAGDNFTGFAAIQKIELKQKKNGENYLSLYLSDSSGRIPGKIWKDAEAVLQKLQTGMIVKIKGIMQQYQDRIELHIDNIRAANEKEINGLQLIPVSKKEPEPLIEDVKQHISSIKNTHLLELLRKLLPSKENLNHFLESPSGKLWHHNYLYGTLESVASMLDIAVTISIHYDYLKIDLLKTAIILRAYARQTAIERKIVIEYSSEGRLLGDKLLAFQTIDTIIRNLEEFPNDLRTELFHLLMFGGDNEEKGMNIPPMTIEGIVLNNIERLDMQTNAAVRIFEQDRVPGSEWTRYNNLFDRFIYVGNKTDNDKSDKQND